MKLSFSTLGCPFYTVDQSIQLANSLGFHGLEIRTLEGTNNLWELEDFKSDSISKTAQRIKDAGLEVVVIGTSISFAKAGLEHQKEKIEETKKCCEIASALHCQYLRVYGGPLKNQTYEECLKWDIDGYQKAIDLASGFGVELLFETHDDFSCSSAMLPLLEGVDKKAGVIWDILHPYRFGESMEDTYHALAPYIKHVHLKDSNNFSAQGFDITLLGEGKVPIKHALNLLKTGGYTGYLSFEWEKFWHQEIPDAEISFPHFIKTIQALL